QQAVLTPPIRPASGLIVWKIIPAIPVGRVILPDRAPLPIGEIRPPALPVGPSNGIFGQAIIFSAGNDGIDRRRCRGGSGHGAILMPIQAECSYRGRRQQTKTLAVRPVPEVPEVPSRFRFTSIFSPHAVSPWSDRRTAEFRSRTAADL